MESGYLSLEVNQLNIGLVKAPVKDLVIRLDAEIMNGFDVFKWASNGDIKFSTSTIKPLLQKQEGDEMAEISSYLNGFNDLVLRSTFIDLNSEVIQGLSNSFIKLKVVSINDNSDIAPPTKPAKGAPVVPTVPAEETLFDITIPLFTMLQRRSAQIDISDCVEKLASTDYLVNVHANIVGRATSLVFVMSADNCLSEFVLGGKFLKWETASLQHLPVSWGLHYADVIDPKAKVQPTASDLRAKYIDNIARLVETQDKVARYSLEVGGEPGNTAVQSAEDEVAESASVLQQMMPRLQLPIGLVAFDREAAAALDATEDIRAKSELWSVSWTKSSQVIFLHRGDARRLVALVNSDPSAAYLPLTIKKSPTAEYLAAEGGELFATALVDVSAIAGVAQTQVDISADLQGQDFADNSTCKFTIRLSCSNPLVPKPALQSLSERNSNAGTLKFDKGLPLDVVAGKQVSSLDSNKDAVGQLRDEITSAIERVAQEYVSLYPIATSPDLRANNNASPSGEDAAAVSAAIAKSQEGRKVEFLNYLSTNGIFHELKERLKSSVQQIIRDKFSARGRALGRSAELRTYDLSRTSGTDNDPVDNDKVEAVLSELYVFLMKECSVVLNSLFSETVVDRQVEELEKSARVNDEEETVLQQLAKLSNQADDAAADSRYEAAEALHLECIHHVSRHACLGSSPETVHSVYSRYGEFLLSYASAALVSSASNHFAESNGSKAIVLRAREALSTAVTANPAAWNVALLYAAVLVECDQQEQAEVVLHQLLASQLDAQQKSSPYGLNTFADFDGYDTDALCPVDPRCYSALAALFSLQNEPLRCRKALRLANRSFAEGGFVPDVSTHGSPKRTLVLTLADTALHFFKFALVRLGQECLRLALSSETAITTKATARGKVATTVPHIKHLLKRAQAVSLLLGLPATEGSGTAVELAAESELVADSATDKLQGWLCLARAQSQTGDAVSVVDSYLNAAERLNEIPLHTARKEASMPLEAFLRVGKILLSAGRFNDALSILLLGSNLYSSGTLFQLVGVSYLRLEQLQNAEEALLVANVMDNRNAEVWAYLCLLCLTYGDHRAEEAEKALEQALRLSLSNAALLRELATGHIAVDKLQLAEDLIRRALQKEGKRPNAHTRRLLGDVLAGQSQAVRAIEEYQAIIADEGVADTNVKLEAAEKCAALLGSIGREEELRTLRGIMASLSSARKEGQTSPSGLVQQ